MRVWAVIILLASCIICARSQSASLAVISCAPESRIARSLHPLHEYPTVNSPEFQIHSNVSQYGYHSELSLRATFQRNDESVSSFLVVQYLPKEVYVDPYQLANLARLGLLPPLHIVGIPDLEKPASLSRNHTLVLFAFATFFSAKLPFHVRYQDVGSTLSTTIRIPVPVVLRSTPPTQSLSQVASGAFDPTRWSRVSFAGEPLEISVPVGQRADERFVTFATFAATIAALLFLLRAIQTAA